jgi:uncharacterized OsmC-like protein
MATLRWKKLNRLKINNHKEKKMSAAVSGKYLGDLLAEAKHEASAEKLLSGSYIERAGKLTSKSFTPAELCASALAICAMITMGFHADNHKLDISGTTFEATPTMSEDSPYRIIKIEVTLNLPDKGFSDKDKASLERAARSCPVHNSLHPDMEQVIVFNWAK